MALIGAADVTTTNWLLLPPLGLLTAAAVCLALFALRDGRWPGVAALALAAGAAVGYAAVPSLTVKLALITHHRDFLGGHWLPVVERLPWLFPLYRWIFAAGFLLLAAAVCLSWRRRPSGEV